jgi:acyl carrier protein
MFEKVKNLLVEEISVDESKITMDAELIRDLGINSLELADLVFRCETEFDVELDDDELANIVTIGDLVNYLESKQA